MIEENKVLEVKNILSYRKTILQDDVNNKLLEIEQFMENNNLKKNGPMINITYGAKKIDSQIEIDLEIMIPVNKKFNSQADYKFKPIFRLVNAVKMRYEGNAIGIQQKYNELNQYIIEKKMTPITGGYNVVKKEANTVSELDKMIIEVYVGIKSDKEDDVNIL